jgi:hypothetical protein
MHLLKSMKYLLFAFILLILSCETTVEESKGSLSGNVILENQSDNSGVTIAIYELAELDAEIVSVNNEYPHIGVIINQHTEFDHRLQTPVKTTTSDSNGDFVVKNFPVGIYNVVLLKQGWGFTYLYEVRIYKGDNDLSNQVVLHEEVIIPDYFQESNNIFETGHHYLFQNDVVLLPDQSLIIQSGAILRISPGIQFKIHGNITLQGEEDNLIWITSNDKFENQSVKSEPEKYNKFEISSIAVLAENMINWVKVDYGIVGLMNQVEGVTILNSTFRFCDIGFQSYNVNYTEIYNILAHHCQEPNSNGVYINSVEGGNVFDNIFISNYHGLEIKDDFIGDVYNNYFSGNGFAGLRILDYSGSINHNEFTSNTNDIAYSGNDAYLQGVMKILYNNFNSETGLKHHQSNNYSIVDSLIINKNNFNSNILFVSYYGRETCLNYFNCDMNYFNGLIQTEEIMEYFLDHWNELYEIVPSLNNIYQNPINSTGIQ